MSEKLSEKLIKTLPHPASGNKITYDSDIKGFGARITAQGAISFILNYRIRGRERRYTIGSYPDWTVAAAREEAKALKRRVDLGEDPSKALLDLPEQFQTNDRCLIKSFCLY